MSTMLRGATIADLEKVEGKAEIVNGKIIHLSPTGGFPGKASLRIATRLDIHEQYRGGGTAYGDNVGFVVNLPNRRSFSPDAAWYTGTDTMKFLVGAPAFTVEVRSENDYGAKAERDIAAKITDYFAAGTLVVWDVDLLNANVVTKYSASDPTNPVIFKRGSVADAEPAVSDWTMPAGALFP